MSLQALQTWADEHKIFSKDLKNETWLKQWDAPPERTPRGHRPAPEAHPY